MSDTAVDTREAGSNVGNMSRKIEIGNVPEALCRRLEARAAKAGLSLSQYLLNEILALAERPMAEDRPSLEEWLARLATRPRVEPTESPVDIIRELRGPLP
jgi:hypothetical protein